MAFLKPVITELPVAVEILERLRWAVALKRKGVEVAPGRLGRRFYESHLPWKPSERVIASKAARILTDLKSPEEMAKTIDREKLESLRAYWEKEIGDWGRAILATMGETLRLRQERAELLEAVEQSTSFFPGMHAFEAARLHDELRSNPDQPPVETRHGILFARAIVICDEFGNELYEDPGDELIAEIARPARDPRVLRRIMRGQKKSVGGVSDVEPSLLRSSKESRSDKRAGSSVLASKPAKKTK